MAKRKQGDVRMKSFRLDQEKIERARQALGATTETETIERALDAVTFQAEALHSLGNLPFDPTFEAPYEDDREP